MPELGPLPGGHHGLTREQILESQRERLLAALADGVANAGYRNLTVTQLAKSASVSTRDFYEHFSDKEECFLATFEAVCDHLAELITSAVAAERRWPDQVVSAMRALLEFFSAEPALARLALVESVGATPKIAIAYRNAVLALAPALVAGRAELDDSDSLPSEAESSIVGGAISLASRKIGTGESDQLPQLLPDLVEFVLGPYLGADRALVLASANAPK